MNPVTDVKGPLAPAAKVPAIAPQATEMKTAPTQAAEVKASPAASVRVITKDELNKKMQAGESMQIVNVLDPEKYALGFIKGSKRIPLDKLEARSSELDKSKLIVTYCASSECNASRQAAEKLTAKGFNARAYEGGIKEWKEAGLPTEA